MCSMLPYSTGILALCIYTIFLIFFLLFLSIPFLSLLFVFVGCCKSDIYQSDAMSVIPAHPSFMCPFNKVMWKRLFLLNFLFDVCMDMFCFTFVLRLSVDLTSLVFTC